MSRLIDADRLLTDRMKSKYYHLPNGDIAIPLIDIEHAPTITPEPKWIPCSERLPDTNGDYLVTGRQGAVNKRRFEDGRWYGNWAVLAWMPLPEPYKGEQE